MQTPTRHAPLRTRTFPFAPATLLAPMEGITHPVFRGEVARLGGVGVVCTEFVRVTATPLSPRVVRREVVRSPDAALCVQVMGNDAARMQEAAGAMAAAGADVVDVNLGCPAPRVVRKGVGSAMLKDPALLFEVLSGIRAAVPGWYSAKMRAGFEDAGQVVELAQVVEASGVDWITVHPRRRADFYAGVADWRIIGVLARTLRVPVVGNGDVWYAADVARMQVETGCHAVMIGRPALRNPWIFAQAASLARGEAPVAPDGAMVVAWIERLASLLCTGPGPHAGIGHLKEQLGWLGRAVRDGGAWRREVLRLGTVDAMLQHSAAVLGPLDADALDLDAWGVEPLERRAGAWEPAGVRAAV